MGVKKLEDGRWEARYFAEAGSEHALVFPDQAQAAGNFIANAREVSRKLIPKLPFAGLIDWFSNHQRFEGKASWQNQKRVLERHAIPMLGDRPIGTVTAEDLLHLQSTLLSKGLSADTTRGVIQLIRTVYDRALALERIKVNQVSARGGTKERGDGLNRLLVRGHVRHIELPSPEWYNQLYNTGSVQLRAALDLIETGVALAELRALRPIDVNIDTGTVGLSRFRTLDGNIALLPRSKQRELQLTEKAILSVVRLLVCGPTRKASDGLLLPPFHAFTLSQECFDAGLLAGPTLRSPFTLESFYNRNIVHLIDEGLDEFAIAGMTGFGTAKQLHTKFLEFFERQAEAQFAKVSGRLHLLLPSLGQPASTDTIK